jgi:hypothetical protein
VARAAGGLVRERGGDCGEDGLGRDPWHVAADSEDAAVCQGLGGKRVEEGALGAAAVEQQAEALPARREGPGAGRGVSHRGACYAGVRRS